MEGLWNAGALEEKIRVKDLENGEEYYVKKAVVWNKKNFIKGKLKSPDG